jgi:hypothetical protein
LIRKALRNHPTHRGAITINPNERAEGAHAVATESDDLLQLSERQVLALEVLTTGGTHAAAAAAAKVNRVTVTTWANHHPGFRAERARRLEAAAAASRERARRTAIKAVEVVENAIDAGDTDVALSYLKWLGPGVALELTFGGATDAESILESEARSEGAADPLVALLDQLDGKPPPSWARAVVEDRHRAALEAAQSTHD